MPDHNEHAARSAGRTPGLVGDFRQRPEGAPMDRPTQDRLGFALRSLYDGLLSEPVPAKLSELVERLERGTRN